MRRLCKHAVLAAFALSLPGCRGCIVATLDQPEVHAALQRLATAAERLPEAVYLHLIGPRVIASAIGAAAPPGGWGGVSVMSTELAWRTAVQQVVDEPRDAANAASVIGMVAGPGGLSVLGTAVAHEAHAERFPGMRPLPCLFAIPPILDQEPAPDDRPANR